MVVFSTRLLLISALASFCANWQFAYQITYVNTSARTFYQLASRAYKNVHGANSSISPEEWSSQWGSIVSSFYPGSVVGFLLMPGMVSRLGTKTAMGILSASAVLGCILQLLAAIPNAGIVVLDIALCGGRFLVGIQAGAALCFLPLYILEISNPSSRSLLNTFQQVSQAVGTLLGLLFGSETLFPLGGYRFAFLQVIAVLPSIMLILLLILTPPTPHYLLREGADVMQVISSLQYYQGTNGDLQTLEQDCASHKRRDSVGKSIPRSSWKGFIIGSFAAISYAFTADDIVDTFSTHILHGAEGTDASNGYVPQLDQAADLMSIALGVILVIASIAGSFLVDRFGRRPLIILGLLSTALFNIAASIFLSSIPSLVLLFFALTKASIGMGAGAPAWFLTSELVSLPFVPLFQSLSTGLLLCFSMLVTFFFLPLTLVSPPLALLSLSAIPALVLALLLFLFLPETKDRTHRQVEMCLSSRFFSGFAVPPQKLSYTNANFSQHEAYFAVLADNLNVECRIDGQLLGIPLQLRKHDPLAAKKPMYVKPSRSSSSRIQESKGGPLEHWCGLCKYGKEDARPTDDRWYGLHLDDQDRKNLLTCSCLKTAAVVVDSLSFII